MSKRRPASSRVPKNVPQHNRPMALAIIIGAGALALMMAWFWFITSGGGLLLTEEKQVAAQDATVQIEPSVPAVEPQTGAESADVDVEIPKEEAKPKLELKAPGRAPGTSATMTEEWEFTEWSILSQGDQMIVSGDLRNVSGIPLTGELVLFVYNDDEYLTRATLNVADFPADVSERVEFLGEDDWQAGNKILLLAFQPL